MIRNTIATIIILFNCLSNTVSAQSTSDFTKNHGHKMALDPDLESNNEGLTFRWPTFMPKLLKFRIGDYKTVNPTGELVDARVNTQDKGTVEVVNAVINSILNNRNVSDYRSRKGTSMGAQRYAISLDLQGYGNTITVTGDVMRFFNAKFTTSGMEGSVETNSQVLTDTTFLAGVIALPDKSNWSVDVEYTKGLSRNVSGEIYKQNVHYKVVSQERDKDGDIMQKVGLLIKLDNKTIAAIEFPKHQGSKGNVLFNPQVSMSDRQAVIGFSALFFSYREILTNF